MVPYYNVVPIISDNMTPSGCIGQFYKVPCLRVIFHQCLTLPARLDEWCWKSIGPRISAGPF